MTEENFRQLSMKWYWFIIVVICPLYLLGNWELAFSKGNLPTEGNVYLAIFRSLLMLVSCYGLYKKFDWSPNFYLSFMYIDSFVIVTTSGALSLVVIIVFFIYLFPQWSYFKKRKHLFNNSNSLSMNKNR